MRTVSVVLLAMVLGACGGRASKACDHVQKLCGSEEVAKSCASDLPDLKEQMGAETYDRMLSCAEEADSCPEAVGCFAGGVSNMLDKWGGQFERGARKMMDKR